MLPWEYALQPVVYKYLAPELFFVLSSASVRFSQRSVFPDDHELQPGYAIFGTQDEIWRYAISIGFPLERNGVPAAIIVAGMAESATAQRLGIQSVMQNTRAIDEVGVFCVTEAANCEQMWTEYAKNGTGFAIGFDPAHVAFDQLKGRGRFGKVSYNDEPIGSALGCLYNEEGVGALYRKRMNFAFEQEWRILRLLTRLESHDGGIFLSPFDPASVREIIIRPECTVETEILQLVDTDGRYKHVKIVRL
jgi:hypothetical protein